MLRGLAAVVTLALFLCACQYSPDTSQRTIAYNRDIASSTTSLFLLNIIRASHRQPTFYTRNQANTATASVGTSLSFTSPLGNTPTTTGVVTSNSSVPSGFTAFLTQNALTRAFTRQAITLTPALTSTEGNQLTLTNLDDQQSINGLMSAISIQQAANYLNEGFSAEELFLLILEKVSVPTYILRRLPQAIAEACASKSSPPFANNAVAHQSDIECEYIFGDAAPSEVTAPHHIPHYTKHDYGSRWGASSQVDHPMHPTCFAGGWFDDPGFKDLDKAAHNEDKFGPPTTSDKVDPVTTYNDPANDQSNMTGPLQNSFTCFHEQLRAFLILGLTPAKGSSTLLYKIPLAYLKGGPRLLSDITQQGLEVATFRYGADKQHAATRRGRHVVARQITREQIAVCRKATDMVLSISPDKFADALFQHADVKPANTGDEEKHRDLDELDQESANSFRIGKAPQTCAEVAKLGTTSGVSERTGIMFTPRSLEAVVYFLGQILRRDTDPTYHLRPVAFVNWRDNRFVEGNSSGAIRNVTYMEQLLHIDKGVPASPIIAEVGGSDGIYSIPELCGGKIDPIRVPGECTPERPNHASAQVLTMLNQIWGLNKTLVTAPIVPTVTLVGGH